MGVLYQANSGDASSGLQSKLQEQIHQQGDIERAKSFYASCCLWIYAVCSDLFSLRCSNSCHQKRIRYQMGCVYYGIHHSDSMGCCIFNFSDWKFIFIIYFFINMNQEYIVYLIITISFAYLFNKFLRKIIRKKSSPCDNCPGCALKHH